MFRYQVHQRALPSARLSGFFFSPRGILINDLYATEIILLIDYTPRNLQLGWNTLGVKSVGVEIVGV